MRLNDRLMASQEENKGFKEQVQGLQFDYGHLQEQFKISQRNVNVLKRDLQRKNNYSAMDKLSEPIDPRSEPRSVPRTNYTTASEGFESRSSQHIWLKWLQGKFKLTDEVIKEIDTVIKK